MSDVDVPPPIHSHSREQKSKNEIQARFKDTVTLPQCFCNLCDKTVTCEENFALPNLLVCPYKHLYLSQYSACCCTTLHKNNKPCGQGIKVDFHKISYIPCFCPRCCDCMRNIVLNKNTGLKEDCISCSKKVKNFKPCLHYRDYCTNAYNDE